MASPSTKYLTMPDPTGRHAAWLMTIDDDTLVIPDPGGQMAAALCIGQDEWLAKLLGDIAEVDRSWVTSWRLPPNRVDTVIQLLQSHGAREITAAEWSRLHAVVSDEAWGRRP